MGGVGGERESPKRDKTPPPLFLPFSSVEIQLKGALYRGRPVTKFLSSFPPLFLFSADGNFHGDLLKQDPKGAGAKHFVSENSAQVRVKDGEGDGGGPKRNIRGPLYI